jgi:hypothetical protein
LTLSARWQHFDGGKVPPGLPEWMRLDDGWASRTGTTPATKRHPYS